MRNHSTKSKNAMAGKDTLNQQNMLEKVLEESFKKMLELKKKLGQPIITSDSKAILLS